jgi:class III poly(R)-hydroxyalkanoic acid synthase PhaC subunit
MQSIPFLKFVNLLNTLSESASLASSYKIIEDWIAYSKSNVNLLSDYGLSYLNTVLSSLNLKQTNTISNSNSTSNNKIKDENNYNYLPLTSLISHLSLYGRLYDISSFEFDKRLRSNDSLQHFKDHIHSIVNLEISTRETPYSFPLFSSTDNLIDSSLKFLETIVSFDQTPYKVVRQEDATRLLHYHPYNNNSFYLSSSSSSVTQSLASESNSNTQIPVVFMIYAPINRYHVLDLSSQRSIVSKFLSAGFDVFLLDWGEKQSEKNKPTIKDYIHYIDKSIEQIQKITNQSKINLYGYSWGGTLAIIYTALYNNKIKNLILQSANYDFDKDDTVIAEWMRSFPADEFLNEFKEMFGHLIDLAFLMRNPIAHGFDVLKYALDMGENEPFKFAQNLVKIRAWINNTPDLPGALFKQFAIDLYQNNLLFKNRLVLKEEGIEDNNKLEKRVDLKNISIPILNIVADKDDLVSSKSSIPITEHKDNNGFISSKDKKLIEFPSNHVELCISYKAHKDLWPQVINWLKERS